MRFRLETFSLKELLLRYPTGHVKVQIWSHVGETGSAIVIPLTVCSSPVQCLLLVLQYMQSSKGSTQTWKIHGAAINLSLQLGLQRQIPSGDPLEDAIVNRVWWMCLLMDR